MLIYQPPDFSPPIPCPYLPRQTLVYEYFFADTLRGAELDRLLELGWRKFGHYFFRPSCPDCRACTPIRIPVHTFTPSRSQRRVWRNGHAVRSSFGPLRYDADLFDLYQRHSRERFAQECSFEDFATSLHSPSAPALLSRYELEGRLVGAGYLDVGEQGLSSVYFVFAPEHAGLSLGVYSVLREVEEAGKRGMSHYYLGYFVPECSRMRYKGRFYPHERYSWTEQRWITALRPK